METTIDWEQRAIEALNAIAEGLGQGANHFYPIIVRQHVIEAAIWIAVPLVMASILLTMAYYNFKNLKDSAVLTPEELEDVRKHNKQQKEEYKHYPSLQDLKPERRLISNLDGTFLAITSIIGLLALLFLVINTCRFSGALINPEYYALKDILNLMK